LHRDDINNQEQWAKNPVQSQKNNTILQTFNRFFSDWEINYVLEVKRKKKNPPQRNILSNENSS